MSAAIKQPSAARSSKSNGGQGSSSTTGGPNGGNQASGNTQIPSSSKPAKGIVSHPKKSSPGTAKILWSSVTATCRNLLGIPSVASPNTIKTFNWNGAELPQEEFYPPPPLAAAPPQPPNWEVSYDRALMSLNAFQTFPVHSSSNEYKTIAGLMSPLRVNSIELIVNPELWKRYCNTRKEMLRAKSDDLKLLSDLGLDEADVLRCAHLSLNFDKDPLLISESGKYSPNEALLFHCTKNEQTLKGILSQGLDERLGRVKGSNLGRGLYFADDPEKSVIYDGTKGTVLVFAVLLGDCLSVDFLHSYTQSFVREPRKLKVQKRNFNDNHFDSITARPDGEFNEYVIFNRYQCCPLYMVRYQTGGTAPTHHHLDMDSLAPYSTARWYMPTIAWRNEDDSDPPMPNQSLNGKWPFYAVSLFDKMVDENESDQYDGDVDDDDDDESYSSALDELNDNMVQDTENLSDIWQPGDRECPICFDETRSPQNWKQLKCQHQLCLACYKRIETVGITMVGKQHTSVRCPFCQEITGILVGNCPDGDMQVNVLKRHCKGYKYFKTIQIRYLIHSGAYHRDSIAYLPATKEGKEVLNLLRTAWDRRLCFTIGNSITSGQQNVLVWNIHHKTAMKGGVAGYGYPDPGYFARVKEELKGFGIEKAGFVYDF